MKQGERYLINDTKRVLLACACYVRESCGHKTVSNFWYTIVILQNKSAPGNLYICFEKVFDPIVRDFLTMRGNVRDPPEHIFLSGWPEQDRLCLEESKTKVTTWRAHDRNHVCHGISNLNE